MIHSIFKSSKVHLLLLTAFLTLGGLKAHSQSLYEVHGNANAWFLVLNHYSITDKLRVGNELHFRRDRWFADQQQFIVRPFVDYRVNKNLSVAAGYSYVRTAPYGDYPEPLVRPEHNVWEQVTLHHTVGATEVSHRYRYEHRRIRDLNAQNELTDSFSKLGRFRYRLTLQRNLSGPFFLHLFDELWVNNFSPSQLRFDRNWASAGIGYRIGPKANVQLAYLHQYIYQHPFLRERHHGVLFTLQADL